MRRVTSGTHKEPGRRKEEYYQVDGRGLDVHRVKGDVIEMKKLLFWTALFILSLSTGLFAQSGAVFTGLGSAPVSGQISCGTTPTLLYSTTTPGGVTPWGRLSITFQNQSSQPVYISPNPGITTSNAGILLGVQYQSVTLDRSSGNVNWYCITGSSTATVGWTEEK
jgi:hypothetical protein